MKTPNLIVRIPEPCHEDWNSMQPDVKGKFCNSCSKPVFDFSTKTDDEIKHILLEYKDQKVCGHFKKSQVDRPLNIKVNLNDLPRNISFSKAFVIAVFLVFGSFLFSCKDEQGQILGDLRFETPKTGETNEERYIIGAAIPALPDSLQNSAYKDSTHIDELFVEGMMTGDIEYVEEYVDGGLMVEEKQCTETPVAIEKETLYTEMVLGLMAMPYVEKMDSTGVEPNDTVSDNSRKVTASEFPQSTKNFGVYPNPGNGEFTVQYVVQKRSDVRLEVFNVNGVLMRTIVNITKQYEGKYQIPVNMYELPNGIYLVTLIIGDKKSVERLVIER